ncbi:MAG: RNA methyltransferase [Candidatus Methanomethyliaceae archaeon]|nr:RNA methyltransferase [Candidatus Methanomethyliaceae archaeon]
MIPKRKSSITIFIPVSILSDVPSLFEKTSKVGQIARAASIFRVDGIVVYRDPTTVNREDAFLIRDLLSYAETPQYLRKKLFPLSRNLKYAGLIPPLRTPHHPLESTNSSFREGFVLKSGAKSSIVDIGLKNPVECPLPLPINRRMTLKLVNGSWLPSSKEEVPYYWGYQVILEFKGLAQLLSMHRYDFSIATSRMGLPLTSVAADLRKALSEGIHVALLFGSPAEGLHEIIKREGAHIEDLVDLVVNTIPNQGTATVRTEEAVMISLAALSSIESTS